MKTSQRQFNPSYHCNPKYAFQATEPLTVPPGPNNPVGVVHAAAVEREQNRIAGGIRLTSWDAHALAKLVHKGTPVDFID